MGWAWTSFSQIYFRIRSVHPPSLLLLLLLFLLLLLLLLLLLIMMMMILLRLYMHDDARLGMWCVPEGREDCRRVLNVTFGDRDGWGVCVPPSR